MEAKKARRRMEVIQQHWAGKLTASDAAKCLMVSRKTYYMWEKRAHEAMLGALQDRETGRPEKDVVPPGPEVQEELETLKKEKQVLEGRLKINDVIKDTIREYMQTGRWDKKKMNGAD